MATTWAEKTKYANRYYESWEQKYRCKTLEQYYRGFHWVDDVETTSLPYTLNLFYATVDIKLAIYTFDRISYLIKPRPEKSDFNMEFALRAALRKQDVLNTLVRNPNANFKEEIEQAIQDSFFRFGIIEVAYSADWIDNPNAGKPVFASDLDPDGDNETVVKQPDKVPSNETIFFKRIDPARFRIGGIEGRYLRQCNWCGYYDFYYARDIKADPSLSGTSEINTVSHRSVEWDFSEEFDDLLKKGDVLKCWTIYDQRTKHRYFWDEANDVILKEDPYERLPFMDLRWIRDRQGWYPIPPGFNWVSPQDEMNEARQSMRSYRRRFVAQFQVQEDSVERAELDKFEEGKDGGIITVKRPDAIQPIQNPTLTNVVGEAMTVGKDDFVVITGTSSEAFGVADRMTATQSIEISNRTRMRETRERAKVMEWICSIGREALLLAKEKMSLGFWIQATVDPGEQTLGEIQENQQVWDYILSQDIDDGVDFDIDAEVASLSPVTNDDDKRKFLEFLALTSQFPQIALSPTLIREAAYRVGYRNEKVIKEMQQMSLIASMGQMAGALPGGDQGPTAGQTAQQIVENQSPNDMEQIRNQMDGQLVQ